MSDDTQLDGATQPPPEARAATAGEFAARWNAHTPEEREAAWQYIRNAMSDSIRCFIQDHEGQLVSQEVARREGRTQAYRAVQHQRPVEPDFEPDAISRAEAHGYRQGIGDALEAIQRLGVNP